MDDALPLLAAAEQDDNDVTKRSDFEFHSFYPTRHKNTTAWQRVVCCGILLLLWLLTAFLFSAIWQPYNYSEIGHVSVFATQKTYSPAQPAIEYVVQLFQQNISEVPAAFRDPTTVDSAWDDLYTSGFRSIISKEEAMLVPNETLWVETGEDGAGREGYVVTLSVFHELHCLDLIRHALEPHYDLKIAAATSLSFGNDVSSGNGHSQTAKLVQPTRYADLQMSDLKDHLNHCLHSLRQAISCHSDISVGVWQWEEALSDYKPNFGTEHTCRNFEKIQEWAKSRSFQIK